MTRHHARLNDFARRADVPRGENVRRWRSRAGKEDLPRVASPVKGSFGISRSGHLPREALSPRGAGAAASYCGISGSQRGNGGAEARFSVAGVEAI